MPLIKNGAFSEDPFETVAGDGPLPANGVIVSLARFKAERETLLARNAPLGVRLSSADSPEALGEDVHRLSVIVLEFPVFRDGRAFSWARMLRTRMGYRGEIRGQGRFLPDQLAFMTRTGIDAFDGDARITPEAVARALSEMTNVYQSAPDGKKTIRELRPPSHS